MKYRLAKNIVFNFIRHMKTVATILLLCFGVFLSTAQSPVKQSDKSGSIKASSNDKVFDENFVMQYPQQVVATITV